MDQVEQAENLCPNNFGISIQEKSPSKIVVPFSKENNF